MDEDTTKEIPPESRRDTARRLPAGIADAGFASLATFAAGLSAVTLFNDVDRGVYAMFFAAFSLGVVLPWNLILVPAEVNAVSFPVVDRMRRARDTLKMGLPMSVLGSVAILVAGFLSRSLTSPDVIWGLVLTALVATVLSPLQDHMRRLLHIAEMSWRAAVTSGVQLFGVVATLGVMLLVDAPVAIMPFGSLAIANALSLTAGLLLGDVHNQRPLEERLRFVELARQGQWLLAQAMLPSVAHFAVAAIIAALAGAAVLGYTESARVVAQPVLVLATGLTAVLAPRAMRAAMDRDLPSAHHARRLYMGLMLGGGFIYLIIAMNDWIWNPMAYIVPSAYVVTGLVAAVIVSNVATAAMYLDVNELLGAKMAKVMAGIAIVTSPILVLVAFTASATGAFARPFGLIVRDAVQIGWYRSTLSRHYAGYDESRWWRWERSK